MNTRDLLGALARTPEPAAAQEPDGYVIGLTTKYGGLGHLTDSTVRERLEAEQELAQWRQQPGGKGFVLCAVTIVEER